MLGDGRLHGGDTLSGNATQLNDRIKGPFRHLIQVEGDGGAVDPRAPVPWPLEVLAGVEEDRYAAKQDRIYDAGPRHSVANRPAQQAEQTVLRWATFVSGVS